MFPTGETIGLIEDDEPVRRALGRLLRSVGLHVTAFASAEEFLQAPGPPPRCLIVDVRLPGMSGLDLQRRLADEGRAAPVVFITAYPNEQERARALQAGALAFLQKPFEEGCLLEALRRALR